MESLLDNQINISGDKVLLVGNRGYRNMGDELILLGNIKLLLQQGKKITIACYEPNWLRDFFSQFFDVNQVSFIPEIPKGIRSFLKYIFKYRMKGFLKFRRSDTIILGGGEILTEENPGAYWYRKMSIWPFLWKKKLENLFNKKNKSDLYIMGGVQIPKNPKKKRQLLSLLKYTTACYLRDFDAVEEIKPYVENCEFFMDTSYFAYGWDKVSPKESIKKPYIVVNLNKNAEQFFDELVQDIKYYLDKGYFVYYVPVAKGNNTYYNDLQYLYRLEECLGKKIDYDLLDWESDFGYFTNVLKGSEKVFSSRLHLYLISAFLGCNTKVYPYQRKILKMQKVMDKVV